MPHRLSDPDHERARGVEIDYCPECRGVWLDRGELDRSSTARRPRLSRSAVAGRADPRRAVPRATRYDDRDRRSEGPGGYRGKKKEHWLGELLAE